MNPTSPNELMAAGIEIELGGRQPSTHSDAILLMNFLAFNIAKGIEDSACKVFAAIYPDVFGMMPEEEIAWIAEFQSRRKPEGN